MTCVVHADALCSGEIWENLDNWVLGLVLADCGIVIDEIIPQLACCVKHDQEVSSHSCGYDRCVLGFAVWELSHLIHIVLELMNQHLAIYYSSSPGLIHDDSLDIAHVISLADHLNMRLSSYIPIGAYWPPSVVPYGIIDAYCNVVRSNVDVMWLYLELGLANDHVVSRAVDDGDLGQ